LQKINYYKEYLTIKFLKIITIIFILTLFPIELYSQKKITDRVIIDTIIIKGNKKTETNVIQTNLLFKQRDTILFDEFILRVKESEQNLKDMQIFTGVEITYKLQKKQNTAKIKIIVTVNERWTLVMYPLYSYDNIKLGTYKLTIAEDNFLGKGYPAEFLFSYNKYDKEGYINFTNVPLFNHHLLISPTIYYYNYKDIILENKNILYEANVLSFGSDIYFIKSLLNRKLNLEFTSHIGQNSTHNIYNAINKQNQEESNWREGFGLKIGRINIDKAILYGGNLHFWFEVAPLNIKEYKIELSKKNFYPISYNNLLGFRINTFYYSLKENLFTTEYVRGIQQGEARGNIGLYANIEYRQHIWHIAYPTEIDVFIPTFIDMGYAAYNNSLIFKNKLIYTVGTGTILYLNYFGGTLQFNIGINIPQYAATNKLKNSLYFSITTGELFFCNDKCNSNINRK
jgi:hypothetical protein